jgi:type II secretory pathway pseudopilin PulG
MNRNARQSGMKQSPVDRAAARAFTLIELLLALGLFTVSIAMVACLFPAAIFQAKAADEHTMASIISQNAMATIRARLTDARLQNQNNVRVAPVVAGFQQLDIDPTLIVDPNTIVPNPAGVDLDPADYLYRYSPGITQYGWIALVRHLAANDYQFMIMPYAVTRGQAPPVFYAAIPVQVNVGTDMTTADLGTAPVLVGAPLIRNSGRYTYIVGQVPDPGNPSRQLAILADSFGFNPGLNPAENMQYCQIASGDKSPILSCVAFRTFLQP